MSKECCGRGRERRRIVFIYRRKKRDGEMERGGGEGDCGNEIKGMECMYGWRLLDEVNDLNG